ncbi:protein DpdD [Streptomyces californicus]|uniref:protein DpdD n=1 Tax=Streptomyces californicus TaxID=67351 RepID=UPI0033C2C39A
MNQTTSWTIDRIQAFLHRFFGEGNDAWPKMDPKHSWTARTEPFVKIALGDNDAPIVLPRWVAENQSYSMYAIARDPADAGKTAELIEAFAGATYIYCNMERGGLRPTLLNRDDPVERAVIDLAGERSTFRLTTGESDKYRQGLTDALLLMQQTYLRRPPRLWRVVKPVGRLIAEFDAALAAGGEAASLDLLEQLAAAGGLTATNLAHLKLKRLDRLGASTKVLQFPALQDVARQDPPAPVKAAILNAVYTVALEEPLAARNLEAAKSNLITHGRAVPELLAGDPRSYGPQAMTVLLLACVILKNAEATRRFVAAAEDFDQAPEIPTLVLNEANALIAQASDDLDASTVAQPEESADTATPINDWPALFFALAEGDSAAKDALDEEQWTLWPTPAEHDGTLAEFLDGLSDGAARELWRAVGSFIDAVGYDDPAPECGHAFIRNAVLFNRYSPGDLAVLQALMEIALRAAPSAEQYAEILRDIGSDTDRWVAPERASAVLDFVDRLFLAACPDPEARTSLCSQLLGPLSAHSRRLTETDLAFARRLSEDLGISFSWDVLAGEDGKESTPVEFPSATLLLYSLDEAVLTRCQEELKRLAPAVKVLTAYDHVGTPQLRQKARTANVIVLATRCAKHAATGFIDQNKTTKHVGYANGSGSASLLRAAVDALRLAAAES